MQRHEQWERKRIPNSVGKQDTVRGASTRIAKSQASATFNTIYKPHQIQAVQSVNQVFLLEDNLKEPPLEREGLMKSQFSRPPAGTCEREVTTTELLHLFVGLENPAWTRKLMSRAANP